jgi:pimeloyl-ACP methyl ester carboxylesterase
MPHTSTDDIPIYYEVAGDPAHPLVVLISGGGAQLLSWHDDFVALLVAEGFRVVRFDNRDTGLSHLTGGPEDLDGGYGIEEMADDVLRVLDDLGVAAAHLVGHSMGGIVAQVAVLRHPSRVLSVGLWSTLPGKDPSHVLHEMPDVDTVPASFPVEQLQEFSAGYARVQSGSYDPREDWQREKSRQAFERGYHPAGFTRQWQAMLRAPERIEALRGVTVPAFVVHGRDDATLHWAGAVAIAQAIPDAELQIHPGMGHLLPWELWPELVAGIVRAAGRSHTNSP